MPAENHVVKVVTTNRRATHDYLIEERYEAGLVLHGTEVKSLREGKCSIVDAFARFSGREAYLEGMTINAYSHGNRYNQPERRGRKLLLHRSEINRLIGAVTQKGYTIVALSVYFKGALVKVEIGLGKGKKHYDRREDIRDRDARRTMDRAMKSRGRDVD
jgi:SsrA-binding protein